MQDTHDLLEEQESRLSQRVEGNSESIQKIADELHGLHDKLEASAEHIVTRVDDVSKDVSREAARLDEELHAVAAELGGRVDRLDSKVSQLNDQRELDRERLSTAVAEVEHDLRARVDSVDQGFAAKLAELAASVKQQVSAAAAGHDRSSEQVRNKVDAAVKMLNEKINTGVDTLAARIDLDIVTLEGKVTSGLELSTAAVQQVDEKVDHNATRSKVQLAEESQKLRDQADTRFAAIDSRLDTELQAAHEKMTKGLNLVDHTLSDLDNKINDSSRALQTRLNEQFAILDAHITGVGKETGSRFGEVDRRADTLTAELERLVAQVGTENEATQASVHGVDAKVGDAFRRLDSQLADLERQHASSNTSLDKKMKDTSAALSDSIEAHYKHFTGTCDELNSRLSEKSVELESRSASVENVLHEHKMYADQKFAAADDSLAKQTELFSERREALQQHFDELCENMERRLSSKCDTQSEQAKAAESRLEEKWLSLQVNTDSKSRELSAELDELRRSFTEAASSSEQRLRERLDDLDSTLAKKTADQDSATRQLGDEIRQSQQRLALSSEEFGQFKTTVSGNFDHLANTCSKLEVTMDDRFTSQVGQIGELNSVVSSNHATLQAACNEVPI